jgi:hypothetical protein
MPVPRLNEGLLWGNNGRSPLPILLVIMSFLPHWSEGQGRPQIVIRSTSSSVISSPVRS